MVLKHLCQPGHLLAKPLEIKTYRPINDIYQDEQMFRPAAFLQKMDCWPTVCIDLKG